ncbi:sugar ABC transporter substrate-binding protein [Vibrio coralliilyticus]|uniref:sugar ABC transporter substrate-binding protein n=2 Tax=Vibrio coralliilyticus TaxID=190893 RepID=UPI000BAAC2B4|nr:sugar ABC transporter substrate-binding protein [Vibrio coralliilyticus]NOI58083.1 sugar ABC transporter substrate-binding protein [Vibrio coralliilyticus]NRF30280.1 sugar ABC transporter substrate-binding protein [Vibrio coralliilyticus]NRF52744.1 sugar ABC transporter substrate-binding protein [Vibrio coralliilyticus]NRG04352.1 sugar ABC transporter substrate-binding protein [Vibrio coralliilyticus]PAT66841.1 sugar ABC transporter substrate-binding protein [Vibrio coralliilyticus]
MPSLHQGLTMLLTKVKQLATTSKTLLKGLLVTSGLLLLTACGQEETKSDVTRVGVAIPNFDDTFMVYMKDAMDKYAQQFDGKVELTFVDAKEDTAKQLGQVENFIVQQMDAIILVPVNTDATQPMTDRILDAGIKLVYLNRRPSYLPESVFYVGSEELKFGETQAEYAANIKDGGNVGILMGMLTQEAAIMRTKGVEDFFQDKPNFDVVRKQTGLWQRAQGMTVMENWLNSGDQLDIILANNDDMALGAIQALRAAGKLDDTLVVGVDATPDGLIAVKNGSLNATVFQDGGGQARGAIDAAVDAVKGKQHDQITWIPAELVTQDNLAAFEAKQKG